MNDGSADLETKANRLASTAFVSSSKLCEGHMQGVYRKTKASMFRRHQVKGFLASAQSMPRYSSEG
jgi:hypothetical protein